VLSIDAANFDWNWGSERGNFLHFDLLVLIPMLLQDICYPEIPHIEVGSSFESILGSTEMEDAMVLTLET
jgi:hypothetical protein